MNTKFWIIISLDNPDWRSAGPGKLMKHPTRDSAEREARMFAELHPGSPIVVLESVLVAISRPVEMMQCATVDDPRRLPKSVFTKLHDPEDRSHFKVKA